MKLASRLQDAWHVLRGKKSVYEIGQALSMLIGRGDDAVFGWQFKASKLLAEEVGAAAFTVYRVKADGSWNSLESHPLLDLLHRPNPLMTRSELFEAVSMSLDFYGNAYLFLEGGDTPSSKPRALHLLNASRISIVRTDSFPEMIAAYKYRERSKEYVFKPHQILHIRESNPVDILKGLGPVQALSDAIDDLVAVHGALFTKSLANPGLSVSVNFVQKTHLEILNSAFGFLNASWYWRIRASGQVDLQQYSDVAATHTLALGKHVDAVQTGKSILNVKNLVRLGWGSGPTYSVYSDATSQAAYGHRDTALSDSGIQNSGSADAKGNGEIARLKDPKTKTLVTVNANYAIETILPGDTIKVLNVPSGSSSLLSGQVLRIQRMEYDGSLAVLHLADISDVFGDELSA